MIAALTWYQAKIFPVSDIPTSIKSVIRLNSRPLTGAVWGLESLLRQPKARVSLVCGSQKKIINMLSKT